LPEVMGDWKCGVDRFRHWIGFKILALFIA